MRTNMWLIPILLLLALLIIYVIPVMIKYVIAPFVAFLILVYAIKKIKEAAL